jgi:hypothetical protein
MDEKVKTRVQFPYGSIKKHAKLYRKFVHARIQCTDATR